MRSPTGPEQLRLALPPAPPAPRRRPPRVVGRNARMAIRVDAVADALEREARSHRRQGNPAAARAALERAAAARRAAAILRAGPTGVRDLMAS